MEWSCWHPLATIYDQDPVITVRLSDLLLIGRRTSRLHFSEPSSAGHPRHQRPIDFQQRQECLVLLPLPYLFFLPELSVTLLLFWKLYESSSSRTLITDRKGQNSAARIDRNEISSAAHWIGNVAACKIYVKKKTAFQTIEQLHE